MNFRQRQINGWLILATAALLAGLWLGRLDLREKITTDVMELVPEQEQQPELAIVRQLASQAESRAMLFSLEKEDGTSAPVEAARIFAAALRRHAVFRTVIAHADAAPQETIGRALFADRFALLFPGWLAARRGQSPAELAKSAATELQQFLPRPEALAWQDLVASDPLLLLPSATARLDLGAFEEAARPGLVWAQLDESPLVEGGQEPAFAAIDAASAQVRVDFPGLVVRYTGINRFAAASRERIKAEVVWLNTLSVVGVLAIAFLFIRNVHRGLHFVPIMAFSLLGAWACTTAIFDRLHVIVFVVGSLLTGAAVDYGFYLFMQPPAHPGEDYWEKVRRLSRPLLASCFTTVAGFGLLLSSDLPMIRHLGVFVAAGLVSALGTAVIYFSTVADPYLPTRELGNLGTRHRARRWIGTAVVVACVLAVPGVARLQWRDDIRDLEMPSPELKANDQHLRSLFGQRSGRSVYLSHGESLEDARAALDRFEAWLTRASGGSARFINLGAAIPTLEQSADAAKFVATHPDFAKTVVAALDAAGFEPDEFEGFQRDYGNFARSADRASSVAALDRLHAALAGPSSMLVHRGENVSWIATVVVGAPNEVPPAGLQTIEVRQLESLNKVFARYRISALRLSLAGLAIVGAGVFAMYGWRDGLRIFAIPCGACLVVFGALGWLGHPLNMFHLLGAFLGVCLTHNYSIFTAASAFRGEPPPVSVRLSALTTAASFGALACSSIPVVHALGLTVLSIVLCALAMIELEHLSPLARVHGK